MRPEPRSSCVRPVPTPSRALARPEVSSVLVTDPELIELDLPDLTYG